MNIVDRIDLLLNSQNKSRQDLADYVGITRSAITTWSKRNSIPSADTAIKIAKYLGCSVEYLFGENENDNIIEDNDTITLISLINTLSPSQKKLAIDLLKVVSGYKIN